MQLVKSKYQKNKFRTSEFCKKSYEALRTKPKRKIVSLQCYEILLEIVEAFADFVFFVSSH